MPGFNIGNQAAAPKGKPGNVERPDGVVYVYMWDIENLIGKAAQDKKSSLIYLKECTPPSRQYDTESVKTTGATYEFAKGVKWNDVKLTFYDVDGISQELQTMADKVWTPDGGIQEANNYMADTTIKVYFHDGTDAYKWVLANSWIKSIATNNMTYESSGVNSVAVTIAYTWAKISGNSFADAAANADAAARANANPSYYDPNKIGPNPWGNTTQASIDLSNYLQSNQSYELAASLDAPGGLSAAWGNAPRRPI